MSTKIEWTNETWNPVSGCSKVSQGCKHCYAERLWPKVSAAEALREGRDQRRPFTEVRCHPDRLLTPMHWRRGKRVFVNSMSDLFHEDVPFDFIDQVFSVMACTTRHNYQVLTKRPERMLEYFNQLEDESGAGRWSEQPLAGREWFWPRQIQPLKVWPQWTPYIEGRRGGYDNCGPIYPLENVWLGVSVEDQATADARIPLLLQTPAAVRFISAEPLLGPIDLRDWLCPTFTSCQARNTSTTALAAIAKAAARQDGWWTGLDWVISGGESGPAARPSHPDWFRSLRDQCGGAGVPFFFKQWGEWWETGSSWRDVDGEHIQIRVGSVQSEEVFERGDLLVARDGSTFDDPEAIPLGVPCRLMTRLGKKAAGRELDGRTHDEYPA